MSYDFLGFVGTFVFQFILSFFSTLFFSVIFNAPKKLLVPCGIVGSAAWLVYYFSTDFGLTEVVASFFGSLFLGIMAHAMARYYKKPVIIFYVAGIIPLVPGGVAYDATKNLIINDYNQAIEKTFQAMLISGAIAFGLIFAEIVFQTFNNLLKQFKERQRNKINL